MKLEERIKNCPFCGGNAGLMRMLAFNGWSIICQNDKCGAHVFFYGAETSRLENAKRWNRRGGKDNDED